jgi:hypothetical protein
MPMLIDASRIRNVSFTRWLRDLTPRGKLGNLVTAGAPIIISLVSLYLQHKPSNTAEAATTSKSSLDNIFILSLGLQLLIVSILTVLLPLGYDREIAHAREEQAVVQRFLAQWKYVWYSWIALYLVLLVFQLLEHNQPPIDCQPWKGILGDLMNNAQTLFLLLAYSILAKAQDKPQPAPGITISTGVDAAIVGVILLSGFEVLFRLVSPQSVPAHDVLSPGRIFSWISSIGSGLALAMFIGRLESSILRIPALLIMSLYMYAMIQTGYAVLGEDPLISILVVNMCLVLKILMFLLVCWLVSSGKLLHYVREMRAIRGESEGRWAEFLQACRVQLQAVATRPQPAVQEPGDQSVAALVAPPRDPSAPL